VIARDPHAEERAPRVLVSVAVAAVVAIDALYLAIIRTQGGSPSDYPLVTPFIAGYFAVVAVALLASLFQAMSVRAFLRGAASGGLLVLAVISALSIGAVVLVAALLSVAATVLTLVRGGRGRDVAFSVVGALVAVVVLIGGLLLAWSVP
jgi:hypothetical protein